jgi:LysR family glycine cleavage system transcriptional activator
VSKRLPPLNPLRAFEATARYLSMSRAATELNVTHGAISHQIRALEKALKTELFHRERGRLRLSPQGSALLPTVSGAFDSIAEAIALLTRPEAEGDIVVSCVQAVMSFWLIPRLGAFAERYPGIRLKLIASNDDRDVYSPDVDLSIRYGSGSWAERHVQLWTRIALFPVCSPTLFGKRPLRNVSDLSGHTLLHADDGREWQDWLIAARAAPAACGPRMLLSDAHLALEAATHGLGIALGDAVTASQLLADRRLIAPFDLAVAAPHAFYFVCRNELRNAPIVRAFTDWLFEEIASDERPLEGVQHIARRPRSATSR